MLLYLHMSLKNVAALEEMIGKKAVKKRIRSKYVSLGDYGMYMLGTEVQCC